MVFGKRCQVHRFIDLYSGETSNCQRCGKFVHSDTYSYCADCSKNGHICAVCGSTVVEDMNKTAPKRK